MEQTVLHENLRKDHKVTLPKGEKSGERPITWFIFAGRKKSDNLLASWVDGTREAMVIDLLRKLEGIDSIDRIVVVSNCDGFLHQIENLDPRLISEKIEPDKTFHFGTELQRCIRKYQPEKLFYWGGGASPFITRELLDSFCASIASGESILYTNNFFSADWVAFTPASAALEIPPPELDNNLAYALWKERGLRSIYIEPSIEIIGDIDTPADLLVLRIHPETGPNVSDYLAGLDLDTSRLRRFCELLKERNRIFLSGRVGSSLFKYLDGRCRCSFRILSEERGMRSFGRIERREVRSLIGTMFTEMGMEKTFKFIESASDGAVLDSRVFFAHLRGSVSTPDRFHSDLGQYQQITDPWVREYTRRMTESNIPVLSGGHSLILGGLWALVSAFGEIPMFY